MTYVLYIMLLIEFISLYIIHVNHITIFFYDLVQNYSHLLTPFLIQGFILNLADRRISNIVSTNFSIIYIYIVHDMNHIKFLGMKPHIISTTQ